MSSGSHNYSFKDREYCEGSGPDGDKYRRPPLQSALHNQPCSAGGLVHRLPLVATIRFD